ncbi:small serum protein 5-like [Paroedura picta]|uniref:small serum protein 5-like n=1 Tax=Paroedura picta TaxID=143630 RepID=UPI0040571F1D
MKVLLTVAISCITLSLCHGACFVQKPKVEMIKGKLVIVHACIDPYDNSKYAPGSKWNTENCLRCSCNNNGEMTCCDRYGGIAVVEGCEAVADPETCMYKFYKTDDPSVPCPWI